MSVFHEFTLCQYVSALVAILASWNSMYRFNMGQDSRMISLCIISAPFLLIFAWPTWLVQVELYNHFGFDTFYQITVPMFIGLILGCAIGHYHGAMIFNLRYGDII